MKFKKGKMEVAAAGKDLTLKAHIKTSKKLRGFKRFVRKKKGPGKGFTAIHRMKVQRKKVYVFTRLLERRKRMWTCVGRTRKKKLMRKFRKVCDSLK